MIRRSPLWMPLAWGVVAVQFGYMRLRLWERFGKVGLLIIGLLGAINIPFSEEIARRIHWWQYSGCRMISFTPWYIVLGEFGIVFVFALLARTLLRGDAVVAGIAGGFSIFVATRSGFGSRIDWSDKTNPAETISCSILAPCDAGECLTAALVFIDEQKYPSNRGPF